MKVRGGVDDESDMKSGNESYAMQLRVEGKWIGHPDAVVVLTIVHIFRVKHLHTGSFAAAIT
jgi:hypothetical protein